MQRKNGFTTVELVVSVVLTMTIAAFLFQIILSLKEMYIKVSVKTNLLTKQSLISRNINRDFNSKVITQINNCGEYCINILFNDNTSKILNVDTINNIITYGDYSLNLLDNSQFGDISANLITMLEVPDDFNNSIITISIPIYHKYYPEDDYGINIVYQFNMQTTPIDSFSF